MFDNTAVAAGRTGTAPSSGTDSHHARPPTTAETHPKGQPRAWSSTSQTTCPRPDWRARAAQLRTEGPALTRCSLLRRLHGRRARRAAASAAERLRHPGVAKSRRRLRRGPLKATGRSRSTSPTGPSTWTWTTAASRHPTLEAFTQRTGVKVNATPRTSTTTASSSARSSRSSAAGQDTGRDIIVLTDRLAARADPPRLGQKLDPANLPHAFANLSPRLPHPRLGPGPRLLLPLAGHRRPSSPTTRRPLDGIEVTPSPTCSTTLAQGTGRACSPRCATASA